MTPPATDISDPATAWVADAVRAAFSDGPVPGPPRAWRRVLPTIRHHRVASLLAPAAARLGVPDDVAERLHALQVRQVKLGLALEHETLAVSKLLHDDDLDHLIVKGVALAAVTGVDAAARGAGDIDVWVPFDLAARATAVLTEAGWVAHNPHAERALDDPGWRRRAIHWLVNEIALTHPERPTVDLHWRLTPAPHELGYEFAEARDRSVTVPIGHGEIPTLCIDDALVHVAHHGRKEAWPLLRHIVDVVRLVDASDPVVVAGAAADDPDVALALALAGRISPACAALSEPSDRVERLAVQAWAGCVSSTVRAGTARGARDRIAEVQRRRLWHLRSASTWRTRIHGPVKAVLSPTALLQPAPPIISLPKHAVEKLRILAGVGRSIRV